MEPFGERVYKNLKPLSNAIIIHLRRNISKICVNLKHLNVTKLSWGCVIYSWNQISPGITASCQL